MAEADIPQASEVVVPAPEELDSRAPCPICRERIVKGAKICINCKSDLSWKRYLAVSNTTLALLTALLAVAGTVGAQIKQLIWPPNSKVSVVWLNSSIDSIPKQVELTVMNTGELAGTVVEATMRLHVDELPPWLTAAVSGARGSASNGWWSKDLIVVPDSKHEGFLIIKAMTFVGPQPPFTLEPGPARRISLEYHYSESEEKPLTGSAPRVEVAHCEVSLGVIDARGRYGGVSTNSTLCRLRSTMGEPMGASAPSGSR